MSSATTSLRGQRPFITPLALELGLGLLRNTDLRAGLPQLQVPSLWLAGRRDRLVSAQALELAAQASPHARYRRIDRAGHAPFLSHSAEVAAEVEAFEAALREGAAA